MKFGMNNNAAEDHYMAMLIDFPPPTIRKNARLTSTDMLSTTIFTKNLSISAIIASLIKHHAMKTYWGVDV
jgi:hypothetical protein